MITTVQVCMAWWAYKSKLLAGFYDFRVYLALHEVDERRQAENRRRRRRGLAPREFLFKPEKLSDEVHSIVGGVGGRHVRAALRRIERVGLVTFPSGRIEFAAGPDRLAADTLSLDEVLERVDKRASVRRRSVPIPRTMVKYVAGGVSPAVAATMFGHAIRCLWWKAARCNAVGSCSTAFVAELFGVHQRTIKTARAHLRDIGWLERIKSDWWHVNRHGARVAVNLDWPGRHGTRAHPARAVAATDSPPSTAGVDTKSPPAETKRNLLTELNNQKPAKSGSTGVREEDRSFKPATLKHVIREDLTDPRRLQQLFRQAQELRLATASECDRLRFFGAAQHARAVATRNPCGLFAALVRNGRWNYITGADEDLARSQLRWLDDSASLIRTRKPPGASHHQRPEVLRCGLATLDTRVLPLITLLAQGCEFTTAHSTASRSPAIKAARREISVCHTPPTNSLEAVPSMHSANTHGPHSATEQTLVRSACGSGPGRPSLTPPGDERSEPGDGRQGGPLVGLRAGSPRPER